MRLQRFDEVSELLAAGRFPVAGLLLAPDARDAEGWVARVAAALGAERYDVRDPATADIRELIVASYALARPRLHVLWQAETLGRASQVALLKVIEEPPPLARMLLVTSDLLGVYDIIRSRCWEWVIPFTPPATEPWRSLCRSASDVEAIRELKLEPVWALAQSVVANLEKAALPNVFAITRRVQEQQQVWFLKLLAYAWAQAEPSALHARGLEYIQHHLYLLLHTQGHPERLVDGVILKLWMGARYGFERVPTVPGVW